MPGQKSTYTRVQNTGASSADVIILAGDIHNGTCGLKWARRHFGSLPVIYVPGNHEFFGGRLQQVLGELRAEARKSHIRVLDGDRVILGGVRFLGTTLWTDFSLHGSAPSEIAHAMADAESTMIDYQEILYVNGERLRAEQSRGCLPLAPNEAFDPCFVVDV